MRIVPRILIVAGCSIAALAGSYATSHASGLTGLRSFVVDTAPEVMACSAKRTNAIQKVAQRCTFSKQSLLPLPLNLDLSDKKDDDKVDPADKQPVTARSFAYHPPGKLHRKDPRTGRVDDRRVYAPDIIFPLALPKGMHPHLNSQIYGFGGGGWNKKGAAGGSECDTRNYNPFQLRDNFCEVRGWKMPMCPSGSGHQGLDIRPPSCADSKWPAVAVVDGTITRVTRNTTVVLKAKKGGTTYQYLHMNPKTIKVKRGDRVKQGDVLGKVSRYMGGKRQTTTHLHFTARQNISTGSRTILAYVPIYTSLIAALRKAKGLGPSIDGDGNLIVDANYEIGAVVPDTPKPDKPEEPIDDKPKPDPKPDPDKPIPPVTDKPDKPDPSPDLGTRVAALEQQLNKLKVASQREIEAAKGEADDAKAALAINEEKLRVANKRVEEREATIRQNTELTRAKEAELKTRIDKAVTQLAAVRAELAELKTNDGKPGAWSRTKSWWQSVWKN